MDGFFAVTLDAVIVWEHILVVVCAEERPSWVVKVFVGMHRVPIREPLFAIRAVLLLVILIWNHSDTSFIDCFVSNVHRSISVCTELIVALIRCMAT